MSVGGPWVMSAMIGRRTEDDVLQIVEEVELAQFAELPQPAELVLVIHVVRGAWQGAIPVRVVGETPSREPIAQLDLDLALPAAAEATGRVVVPLALQAVQAGVYWFDVVVGETNMTRVPLPVR